MSFWNRNLFFNYDFIRFFIRFRLPLRTFWMPGPLFRFFVLYGRKLYFGMRSWDQLEKNQKMCHFETGTYFSISILFVFFFRFRLPLRTFWRPYRDIFSIFCLKRQEIAFFSVKYSQILLKLRNSLLKGAKIPDILPNFFRFPDE